MAKTNYCILTNDEEQANANDWENQLVYIPVRKLLYYERSEQERLEWARRNRELQDEIERLRGGA